MVLKVSQVGFGSVPAANAANNKKTNKVQKSNAGMTTPVNTAGSDTFKKNSQFDVAGAVKTFSNIKTNQFGVEVPKFNDTQLKKIGTALAYSPEKFEPLSSLAKKDNVSANSVVTLSTQSADKLTVLDKYAEAANSKGQPRYMGSDLVTFANKNKTQELVNAQPLTKTSLSVDNISLLGKTKKLGFNTKAADKVADFEKNVMKDNFKSIVFASDLYDEVAYTITAKNFDNSSKKALLSPQLNTDAVEETYFYKSNDKRFMITKSNDLRNNATSKVRYEIDKDGYPNVTNEVRVVKDKNGKVVKTEYTAPSEVPGVFDIKVKHANGKEDVVSSGKINKKTGIVSVKKNMTSLNGTKTEYLFEDDKNGNRISEYKITDKNGKVLLNKNSTFEVINKNKIISTNNGDSYEILLNDKQIKVTDMNNPKRGAVIDIDKSIQGNKQKILASLKEMPGEELIKLAQSTKSLTGINSVLESYYQPADKSIHSGDQLFVILHELGHARDFRDVDTSSDYKFQESIYNAIFADEKFGEIYDKEKANFVKAFPDAQRNHIDYFTNSLTHYGGAFGGIRETIAESNALLTTPETMECLAIRSQYLQQYFPETIAKLSELLSKESPNYTTSTNA